MPIGATYLSVAVCGSGHPDSDSSFWYPWWDNSQISTSCPHCEEDRTGLKQSAQKIEGTLLLLNIFYTDTAHWQFCKKERSRKVVIKFETQERG